METKTFEEIRAERQALVLETETKLFSEHMAEYEKFAKMGLTEQENQTIDKWVAIFEQECGNDINKIDEGFLGRVVGGVGGFLVGPTIGRIIANALGIKQGILYDMFTSRLVSAALGSAISKSISSK